MWHVNVDCFRWGPGSSGNRYLKDVSKWAIHGDVGWINQYAGPKAEWNLWARPVPGAAKRLEQSEQTIGIWWLFCFFVCLFVFWVKWELPNDFAAWRGAEVGLEGEAGRPASRLLQLTRWNSIVTHTRMMAAEVAKSNWIQYKIWDQVCRIADRPDVKCKG